MGPKRTSFDEMKKASMHRVSSQDQVTVKQGHVLWNPRPIRQGAALQYKSKIICTLGPSSRDVPVMEQMLKVRRRRLGGMSRCTPCALSRK